MFGKTKSNRVDSPIERSVLIGVQKNGLKDLYRVEGTVEQVEKDVLRARLNHNFITLEGDRVNPNNVVTIGVPRYGRADE